MFCFLLYQSFSVGSLGYSDNDNKVIVNCSTDFSGEVVIPSGVTEIYSISYKEYVFKNCKDSITSLRFDSNSQITSISKYSFYKTSLESVDMSECKNLNLLNESIFDQCYNLNSVILPPNISSIGNGCFSGDLKLSSIVLRDSVLTLNNNAFSSSGLTTINISINSKLEKLDQTCFSYSNLSSFFIPKFLISIYDVNFADCPLENITVHPENNKFKIDHDTFSVFIGIDNSILFRVVTTYPYNQYIVPSYVTTINGFCFCKCSNITSIQIHDNVREFHSFAFQYSTGLITIIIPEKISRIISHLFGHCTSLTNITIHDNVKEIGYRAFEYCSSLTKIAIPEKLTSIANEVFQYCMSLTDITIPINVTKIDNHLFQYCKSLRNITIPERVTEIGISVFYHCTNLQWISIKGTTSKLDYRIFSNCNNLASIIIPKNVIEIGVGAFSWCTSLTSITIPENVKLIKNGAFYCCNNLKSITFLSKAIPITFESSLFQGILIPMNIFIPGNFNISVYYENAFYYKSHLYITSKTILSESCKTFFGEKRMIVHFLDMTKVSD